MHGWINCLIMMLCVYTIFDLFIPAREFGSWWDYICNKLPAISDVEGSNMFYFHIWSEIGVIFNYYTRSKCILVIWVGDEDNLEQSVHRAIEGSERSPVLNACSLISPRGEVNRREKLVPNTWWVWELTKNVYKWDLNWVSHYRVYGKPGLMLLQMSSLSFDI